MMQRLVTVCVGALLLFAQGRAAASNSELYLYGVTIESTVSADEDSRGDILEDPRKIRILNLGKVINHKGLDYGPTISADGKTLYYVSNRQGSRVTKDGDFSHDFWSAKKDNNLDTIFYAPVNIDTVDAGVNTIMNEGVASIAADRQTLYFTGCNRPDGLGDCDIYVAEIEGDRWSKPRNLGRTVNSEFWDSQPTITPDKSRLYFSSNRPSPTNPDGEGDDDIDIWYCDWDDDLGEWKAAKNMGPEVNTAKQEVSPFIGSDGYTLFFASNGLLPNMGGLDFYRTKKTGEKDRDGREKWSKPEQLPAPINTNQDEQFISLPASGDVLYFSSRRTDISGFQGDLDVFMAFIPSYFRAVNVIVNVIDECTGQNIPATLTFRNNKTARTQKDSVDQQRTENNLIVSNDDYGTGATREDSTTLTVTAYSPNYGERSIVIGVKDPGKTTNASEANQQTEIRKTITLGQRPVLNAEMEFSRWAKKLNNSFKGLVMEERATIQLYPMLPYVFFDLNSSAMPSRYKLITASQTNGFNDELLPGGTLDKYYHVLNIFGYRLKKYPNVKVELVGCVDEKNEDKNSSLPKERAQLVYDYLKNVWGIGEDRMKVTARGWPELRSNPNDTFGIVENRRTELRFSGGSSDDLWEVQRPILDNDPTVTPDPDQMNWTMKNGIDAGIVASRRIEVFRNSQPWNVLKEIGTVDPTKQWDWTNTDMEYPQEKGPEGTAEINLNPYKAVLVVTSKNGQECKSDTVTIPVKRVSSKSIGVDKGAEFTLEKYNLILFKFDSPEAGELNERIMSTWVFPRVKKSSVISIDGHTDVVGLDTRNKKLSEDRARTAENFIKKRTSDFKELNTRGTGEEEPLYSNELPEGRFFNRTVQVKIETPLIDAELGE
ncbi:MAG: PD40 domain-containing protein [Ignavibacteria bacterium]|nr:PD40 domain-containing protein [Ignavibacteria bacterium]MBK6419744.1 PD40 domain-containing protein [Ignavibacteria bacterium]MBK6759625.1 PD40 domain-containing protein [Ignavibacteria bacterium]MBK7184517.1 PD40 domain-containing protein [Ignavibacteria bacterium]MBK7413319.1 PD40 domain-containing protein [Ignavibacteria bacterium]